MSRRDLQEIRSELERRCRAPQRAAFVPVSAPIVYVKSDDFKGAPLGEIRESRAADYRRILVETMEQGYARLLAP